MGYIDKNLLDNETLVYWTRRHKIIFALPVLWLLLSISLFAARFFWVFRPEIDMVLLVFAIIFAVASVIHGVIVWINYLSAEFGVTNQRVIVKEGFIQRATVEVFLRRVESVKVDQSIWGRMLNFGTVVVSGTGGINDPFLMIRRPLEFKRQVQQQLSRV